MCNICLIKENLNCEIYVDKTSKYIENFVCVKKALNLINTFNDL
jgi:hypothetical protein